MNPRQNSSGRQFGDWFDYYAGRLAIYVGAGYLYYRLRMIGGNEGRK